MRRFQMSLVLASAAISAAPLSRAAAQARPAPAAAYVADAVVTDLPAGLDTAIPVRIADARTGAPAVGARLVSARLTSPFDAAIPVRDEPGGDQPGVRLFRADLLSPGSWTLELVFAGPTGAITRASVGFTVVATAARTFAADPAGAAAGPATAAVLPQEPQSSSLRGSGAPGDAVAPTLSPPGRSAPPPSLSPAVEGPH